LDSDRLEVEVLHRFPNTPVQMAGHLHWDVPRLWLEIVEGLKKAPKGIESLGVDGWGVDYVLLGPDDDLLALPSHYRHPRNLAAYDRVLARLSKELIFSETGVQFMPINTLYQLEAQRHANPKLLEGAAAFLMLPDYIHFLLSGQKAVEWTNASTSQIANPYSRTWSEQLLDGLGVPKPIFSKPVEPGTLLGSLRPEVEREIGQGIKVVAPATHDTASAVAAVPAQGQDWAYISSGTWSLVGVELPQPITDAATLAMNLTNEGGLDGTTRLLKNVMGLWLLQECRHAWDNRYSYGELAAMAEPLQPFRSIVNPDFADFLLTNDVAGPMPERIRSYCRETGQPLPETEAQIARCVYDSLALKYRQVLDGLERITGQQIRRVHIVGGGSQNKLLCQLSADVTGREVLAGPVEGTTIGNLLVTARTVGQLQGDLRSVVRNSFPHERFVPREVKGLEEAYQRLQGLP
jgi:rhamnulokinase